MTTFFTQPDRFLGTNRPVLQFLRNIVFASVSTFVLYLGQIRIIIQNQGVIFASVQNINLVSDHLGQLTTKKHF